MKPESGRGPSFADLRPLHENPQSDTFPVYADLTDKLLTAADPDDVVRHVLATCAGYAYSDLDTVTMMMTRLGLENARCVVVREIVDAMFICSTAYVIQSADGRVVILCYRGTEPANLVNWLTDLDVQPDLVSYDLRGPANAPPPAESDYSVHAGFYRNVRATRYAVIDLLQRAHLGQSIITGDDDDTAVAPMQALYVTGHSLGAAMAALMTVMLRAKSIYSELAATLKATYTYGQPMIGTEPFAAACTGATFGGDTTPLTTSLFRYVYADDLVPQLPPTLSGEFAHFGEEFRCPRIKGRSRPTWTRSVNPIGQTGALGIMVGSLALVTSQVTKLSKLPFHQSIVDHGPQNYIAALTPAGIRSEFGD